MGNKINSSRRLGTLQGLGYVPAPAPTTFAPSPSSQPKFHLPPTAGNSRNLTCREELVRQPGPCPSCGDKVRAQHTRNTHHASLGFSPPAPLEGTQTGSKASSSSEAVCGDDPTSPLQCPSESTQSDPLGSALSVQSDKIGTACCSGQKPCKPGMTPAARGPVSVHSVSRQGAVASYSSHRPRPRESNAKSHCTAKDHGQQDRSTLPACAP